MLENELYSHRKDTKNYDASRGPAKAWPLYLALEDVVHVVNAGSEEDGETK